MTRIGVAAIIVCGVLDASVLARSGQSTGTSPTIADPQAPSAVPTTVPATSQAPPARQSAPAGTGAWPDWLSLGFQYRGRVERTRGLTAVSRVSDAYYLNRLRADLRARAGRWGSLVIQAQDSTVAGHSISPPPRTVENRLDLRIGYVELTPLRGQRLVIRAGRQNTMLGEGRLLASPDWGNTNRTFDGYRVTGGAGSLTIDLLALSPVDIQQRRFDRHRAREWIAGGQVAVASPRSGRTVEVYSLVKAVRTATGEFGDQGSGRVYSAGLRALGPAGSRAGYNIEWVLQRGHIVSDSVSAWAGHTSLWLTVSSKVWPSKLVLEYNVASGDDDPRDRRRTTFDQLHPTNHGRYGLSDPVGWRNVDHLVGLLEVAPSSRLTITGSVSSVRLRTVRDALYGSLGIALMVNREAPSRVVGRQIDLWGSYSVSKDVTIGGGLGVTVKGDYFGAAGEGDRVVYPYLQWTVRR